MSNLGNKQVMANNIKKYMNKFNISQTKLCNELNLKQSTFSDWVNAKTYPRIDKIELLANYFGVNKSNLVEKSTTLNNINLHYNDPWKETDAVIGEIIKTTRINKGLTIEELANKIKQNGGNLSVTDISKIEEGEYNFASFEKDIILSLLATALETSITYFYMNDESVINAFASRFGINAKDIITKTLDLDKENINKVNEYIKLLLLSQK